MLTDTAPTVDCPGARSPGRDHSLQPRGGSQQGLTGRHGHDREELLAAIAVDAVVGPDRALDSLDHPSQDLVAGEVAPPVVHRLEVVQVDHEEAVTHARSVDVGADGPEVLVEAEAVAGAGEGIGASRELQRVVRSLELDHFRVGKPPQRPDPVELGEVPDLGQLEEHVSGDARPERGEQHAHEGTLLDGGEVPPGSMPTPVVAITA